MIPRAICFLNNITVTLRAPWPYRSWLFSALVIYSFFSGCALTKSPRLHEPEPFIPNITSIPEPIRSAFYLAPLNLESEQNQSETSQQDQQNEASTKQSVVDSHSLNNGSGTPKHEVDDNPPPLVYRLKLSEPTRTRLKFPKKPVMLAAMKSCGKISDQSHNEGFVRQLFVGWKGAKGVAVRSLEIQGQKIAIAKGSGDIAGSPVSLIALTKRSEKCVYDLTVWSEDSALLEISSEGLTALGMILVMS